MPGGAAAARRYPRENAPALIAVAHGSRDPRSAATMRAVVELIAAQRPDLDVRLAFLDLSTPSVDQVVDAVAADGHSHAVVVPLLLGSAFHARVDLPGLLDAARARHPRLRVTQADVLGPDPHLIIALRDRIVAALHADFAPGPTGIHTAPVDPRDRHAGMTGDAAARMIGDAAACTPRLGVAVAAVGSSSAAANARTGDVARLLTALTGWDTEICFATTDPTLDKAFARLRARGAQRILVAPWFLAPGLLTDRLRGVLPQVPHAETLGAHPLLAEVALDRYATAALPLELSA
ncbi:sirohydrochlorin chelatase [Nocardia seriolae]|uniref:sirohydrochlorin chelatase n=1 Tax=Nocardia seriolae TaxID=37332 RepID=UPI0005EFA105|nr:CbiX/SirB N-terminal domain-containing protein [Nocardia seriolae]WKY56133.1 CbiX/SirB N-terminal domain-containing protein [Nocardia seriolae]WNJ62886.1 CbiX/SirB N-terminal domain-containing protein [Nocardia seriolae]